MHSIELAEFLSTDASAGAAEAEPGSRADAEYLMSLGYILSREGQDQEEGVEQGEGGETSDVAAGDDQA